MIYLETGFFHWNMACGFGRYLNDLAECMSYDGIICFQTEAENVPGKEKRKIIALNDKNYRDELQQFVYNCKEGDIIHFPMNTIIPITIPSYIQVVYTIHDITPIVMQRFAKGKKGKTWNYLSDGTLLDVCELKKNISYSLKRANRIITISNSTRNDIVTYFNVPVERITLIYNAVSSKFNTIQKEKIDHLKENLHIKNKTVFLTAFSACRTKNSFRTILAYLLYLAMYNRKSILILTGRKNWKKTVLLFPFLITRRVLLTGYLTDEELCEYYNLADCLLFLSLYEGFGWPPLEAMACKTHVISANNSSLKELLSGYAVLVSEPRSIREIVNALKNFSRAGIYDKQILDKAYRYAHSFTKPDFLEKHENLFKNMKNEDALSDDQNVSCNM